MKTMLVAAVATTALAVCAPGAGANALDAHWLKADARANVSEIGAAKWMLGQTDNADVRALAKRLIRDHEHRAAKEEVAGGNIAPVVAAARASLPVLHTHLAMARRTLSQLT